ncbi:zinc dependent phospholipase C family protein [Brassicibacter mesophilus]|jgi:zinc dependent phospholipase C|uniref:zinc dependent phospholipase C family protein n=1 Tax=Brassicibacter mesophilus TaxID=745119 RepID=UPI003D1CD06F
MPDILTHILCGQDTVKCLENSSWKSIIASKPKIFNLGCQGPDMFLYNDFWPCIKDKRGLKYGRMMHTQKTGDFLIESISYLNEEEIDKDNFRIIFSYISGFICHFSLDRNAHPYIHYHAGAHDANKTETRRFAGYHKRLELIIDTILLNERENAESFKYPVYQEIDVGKSLPKSIVRYLAHTIGKVYSPKKIINYINDSYKDFTTVLKLSYDPSGIKKGLLTVADVVSKDDIAYKTLIYPRKIDSQIDYMNSSRNIWNHPCNKDETYSHSFYDLYDKAVVESTDMINAFIAFLENKINISQLKEFFPNISYHTGKIIDEKCELKYYEPIFDR